MRARSHRVTIGRGIAVATSIVLVGCATAIGTTASATASTISIDTSSESSVASAYNSTYLPAMQDTVGWTGSVSGCNPGTTSAQSQQDSLDIINFDRALAGLDPVTLDAALNADAQAGALIMSANNNLSHNVPTTWACYSKQGADAAASSDLFLGEAGAKSVDGYMIDPGTNNTEAGHRRWILYPPATTMGTGSTNNSNDLYIFGGRAAAGNYADPSWVSWPTAGYFPEPLEPDGRWSLGGSAEHSYDFDNATVTVKTASGTSLPVTVNSPAYGYGADTIVFQVSGLATPGTTPVNYTVTVSGIVEGSTTLTHSYVVSLFDPAAPATAPPLPPVTATTTSVAAGASLTGYSRVGQVLRTVSPRFSPATTSFTYEWYRNGRRIANATHATHTLTSHDLGKRIQVRVFGHRKGVKTQSSLSPASTVVGSRLYPTALARPKLIGTDRVGQWLAAAGGTWSPGTVKLTYQWYRGGKAIKGATSSTHALTVHDAGHTISVKVTAHAPGYSSRSYLVKEAHRTAR
jgi:uncharacterized protein YkwD